MQHCSIYLCMCTTLHGLPSHGATLFYILVYVYNTSWTTFTRCNTVLYTCVCVQHFMDYFTRCNTVLYTCVCVQHFMDYFTRCNAVLYTCECVQHFMDYLHTVQHCSIYLYMCTTLHGLPSHGATLFCIPVYVYNTDNLHTVKHCSIYLRMCSTLMTFTR